MQQDDYRLVQKARSGDLSAFGELYHLYSPGVYNLVLRMLGNPDDAEDVKQEVFLRAHRALGSFKGDSKFSTWIYRIAANLCLDEIRKRKPNISTDALIEDSGWEMADEEQGGNPEQSALGKVTKEAVRSALLSLPPHYRILIVLRHLEDLSYEEISKVAGCSLNSLNVRLHRAREAFRKAIAPFIDQETNENDLQARSKT